MEAGFRTRLGPSFGARLSEPIFWSSIFGAPIQSHLWGSIFGTLFWSHIFGTRFSPTFLAKIFGTHFESPIFGADSWGPIQAQFSEHRFRDPSHSHLWGSIFEADYLDPLLGFDFWDMIRWTPGTPWSDLGARLVRPCCDLCAPSGAPRCSPGYSFLALSVTPSATPVRLGTPMVLPCILCYGPWCTLEKPLDTLLWSLVRLGTPLDTRFWSLVQRRCTS